MKPRAWLLLFTVVHPSLSFLPASRLRAPVFTTKHRYGTLLRMAVDPAQANKEFEEALYERKDIVCTLQLLKKYQNEIDLDWKKSTALLDQISKPDAFKGVSNILEEAKKEEDYQEEAYERMKLYLENYESAQHDGLYFVYNLLKSKSLLKAYSYVKDFDAYDTPYLPRRISPEDLEERSSLPMSALTPGKAESYWQYAGIALCIVELLICRFIGIDAGAVIPGTIAFFIADRIFFSGTLFDLCCTLIIPKYKERITRHEAGHFLVAYLLGCPIQRCILRPVFSGGLVGQAGTIFYDKKLLEDVKKNKLSASSIDRYTTIVMAGIAAEAMWFGNAEGGASDERALLMLLGMMSPPWDLDKITNQARWAVLRALLILKDHKATYEALVQALQKGQDLGYCVKLIEDSLGSVEPLPAMSRVGQIRKNEQTAAYGDMKRVMSEGAAAEREDSKVAIERRLRQLDEIMSKIPEQISKIDGGEPASWIGPPTIVEERGEVRKAEAVLVEELEVIQKQEAKENAEIEKKNEDYDSKIAQLERQLQELNSRISSAKTGTKELEK